MGMSYGDAGVDLDAPLGQQVRHVGGAVVDGTIDAIVSENAARLFGWSG